MKKKNFTLIELLVVIGIIGILLGILIPAVAAAMKEGKRTKAHATCKQIAMACASYRNDYGSNVIDQEAAMDFNAIRHVFKSVAPPATPNNARNKEYFTTKGDIRNPWGKVFYVQFDHDYNGEVSTDLGVVARRVAVWTIDDSGKVIGLQE